MCVAVSVPDSPAPREHSYALDDGAAAAKYVDAFFVNVKRDEVERRYERSQAALKVLASR